MKKYLHSIFIAFYYMKTVPVIANVSTTNHNNNNIFSVVFKKKQNIFETS